MNSLLKCAKHLIVNDELKRLRLGRKIEIDYEQEIKGLETYMLKISN